MYVHERQSISSSLHINNKCSFTIPHKLMGLCKKTMDLLDAIILLGNMLTIHKNKTRSCYVMLGSVWFRQMFVS